MSKYAESHYEIERRRRQELFNQRVRDTTRNYLEKYRKVLGDVQSQGLVEYAATEFLEIEREITHLTQLLESDPVSARDQSISLGNRVHSLPRQARGMRQAMQQAQRAAEEAEREAKREEERLRVEKIAKVREDLERAWQDELTNWGDRFARQLAFKALTEVRVRLLGADVLMSVDGLRSSLNAIKREHDQKAQEIREQEVKAASKEAAEESAQLCREQIAQVTGPAAERAHALAATLGIAGDLSPEELSKRLIDVTGELDNAMVDESCRREVVQAVYRALEDAGFVTERPRLVRDGSNDEVVIHGRRPAGAQAVFKVELNGKLNYKFDRYRGSACRKDIATVLPRLQSVYGIQLSNDRVIWENPDDEDRDAKPQPGMTKEK